MNKEAEGVFHIGRVAVSKAHRKQGLGAKVIKEAEGAAKDMGGRLITIGSQVQAVGFYMSLGYIKEGEEYIEEGKPHIKVYKKI
jgi:predicted GNAT family N-acyltransferase